MPLKVLHITNWFPTKQSPKTAIWIKNHLDALGQTDCSNTVYHIEVGQGKSEISLGVEELFGNKKYMIRNPYIPWFIIEILSTILILFVIRKERKQQYDCINFHIAYPNLTYWYLIRKLIDKPAIITEHWSAYHLNFGAPLSNHLPRIKRIFRNGLPVIAVSDALIKDIQRFSHRSDFPTYVVPNIVKSRTFHFKDSKIVKQFFMLSQWKYPKDPFKTIQVFNDFHIKNPDYQLKIGGYGAQLKEMKNLVRLLKLEPHVKFLGSMTESEIATEMNKSVAFIHISEYETFSVVCAEAIACGCPVIASSVGGIKEFINKRNGVLIKKNSASLILEAFEICVNAHWQREQISFEAKALHEEGRIGEKYKEIISLYKK